MCHQRRRLSHRRVGPTSSGARGRDCREACCNREISMKPHKKVRHEGDTLLLNAASSPVFCDNSVRACARCDVLRPAKPAGQVNPRIGDPTLCQRAPRESGTASERRGRQARQVPADSRKSRQQTVSTFQADANVSRRSLSTRFENGDQ